MYDCFNPDLLFSLWRIGPIVVTTMGGSAAVWFSPTDVQWFSGCISVQRGLAAAAQDIIESYGTAVGLRLDVLDLCREIHYGNWVLQDNPAWADWAHVFDLPF